MFSQACAPLRMLGVSVIQLSQRVAQNCAVLQPKFSNHTIDREKFALSLTHVWNCFCSYLAGSHASRIVVLLACSRLKRRDLRKSCRAAGAAGHDSDGRCKILRSGSVGWSRVTAAAAVHSALARDRKPSRSTALRGRLCCTSTCRLVCRRSEFPPASRSLDNPRRRGQSSS